MFDFSEQYKVGYAMEDFLIRAHPYLKRAMPGERRFDLVDTRPPFRRVEVKCDTYGMGDTPFFFMERSTVVQGRKGGFLLGGPWRAARDAVDVFIYAYQNGGTKAEPSAPVAFHFDNVPALVKRLDELVADTTFLKRNTRKVWSPKVVATGLLVDRDLLADLDGVMMVTYIPNEPDTSTPGGQG